MTKSEMVAQIAREAGINESDVSCVINLYHEILKAAIRTGEPLQIKGFGTFTKRMKKQREYVNPRTGERMITPAKEYIAYKQSGAFKI